MTVEEIEIIVTAQVEEALKEFQKFLPAIKQTIKQAQEALSKVDTRAMTSKLQQAVNLAKKKMQNLKKSSENNEIAIKVNNKDAEKQITQLEKEIDSLQKKITGRQMKLDIINPQMDKIVNDTRNQVVPDGISKNDKSMDTVVNNALASNKDFTSLDSQAQKLYTEIEMYNKQLSEAKSKMSQLKQGINQTATSQGKLTSFFSGFKQKIDQIKPSILNMKNSFKSLPKITKDMSNNIKGMCAGLKNGLGHVLKYAMALLSLRGVYSILSGCANAWLSSQNAGAKQLSANINYMKYAMGSALAPVIQFVTNLVYQLMKAIQSVAYALTGVNIFAKASANSYASMAGSAKKAKQETKALAGVHSEINNISDKDNSNGGSGGATAPSFDLSGIDNQMSPIAQKLYDFFKPLVDSWNKYGSALVEQIKTTAGQVVSLMSAVWGSLEKIITNGTVYTSLELILAIIGNIAKAFANAWKYNGNGDAIVQNLANAFNNLLSAINNVVKSEGFQNWLNNCSNKFRDISEKISEIDWQPLIDALSNIGQNIGTVALDILNGLVNIFKWLVENPIVAEILLSIAIAIGVVAGAISLYTTAMGIYNVVMPIATAVSTAFGISIGWLIAIIVAIIAVIALVVLAIMNWDNIIKALKDTWEWIKQKAIEIWNAIAEFFKNLWQKICDTVKTVWNGIKEFLSNLWNGILNIVKTVFNAVATFFSNIWNGIKNVVTTVWNAITNTISRVINGIKNTISNVLNGIKNIWNNIWNGLKTTVTNIFNGIWNTIKRIINSILGGIEGMANGVVRGVNAVIKTLNKLKFDIPDWVPGVGGKTFGFNIGLMSEVSLPRLAKGNVAYDKTLAVFGEYAGASNNPEITTPQNIMRETFEDVLSNYNNENSDRPINIAIYVGKTKLGQILLDDLRDMKRQTGKDIEALVGG